MNSLDRTDLCSELDSLKRQGIVTGYSVTRYWKEDVWTVIAKSGIWEMESPALRVILDSWSFHAPMTKGH